MIDAHNRSLISCPLFTVATDSAPLSGEWRVVVETDCARKDKGWVDPGFDNSDRVAVTVSHTCNGWQSVPQNTMAWFGTAGPSRFLTFSIVQPTVFSVIERSPNSHGEVLSTR
jgi:hypothetical protein